MIEPTSGFWVALIEDLLSERLTARDFCLKFERHWNFDRNESLLSSSALSALDGLFSEVILFSPLDRADWEYPKYRSADDIRRSAAETLDKITAA
jgi:hypothetical protein